MQQEIPQDRGGGESHEEDCAHEQQPQEQMEAPGPMESPEASASGQQGPPSSGQQGPPSPGQQGPPSPGQQGGDCSHAESQPQGTPFPQGAPFPPYMQSGGQPHMQTPGPQPQMGYPGPQPQMGYPGPQPQMPPHPQGFAQPGPAPGYQQPFMGGPQPFPGSDPGCSGGNGGPGHPKHDQHQFGQLTGLISEFANGNPDLTRVAALVDGIGPQFWKGALIGAAATLLLTNDGVKTKLGDVLGSFTQTANATEDA